MLTSTMCTRTGDGTGIKLIPTTHHYRSMPIADETQNSTRTKDCLIIEDLKP